MIRNAQERERRIRTGLAFQERIRRKIIEAFLKCFPQLKKEGIRSCKAFNNGSDIVLSSDWRRHLPSSQFRTRHQRKFFLTNIRHKFNFFVEQQIINNNRFYRFFLAYNKTLSLALQKHAFCCADTT